MRVTDKRIELPPPQLNARKIRLDGIFTRDMLVYLQQNRLLALLYYRESLHFIQPFSLTFAALPSLPILVSDRRRVFLYIRSHFGLTREARNHRCHGFRQWRAVER